MTRSGRRMASTISRNRAVQTGSRPCVGSSNTTSRMSSCSSACAMPTRWKLPLDSAFSRFPRCSPIANAPTTRSTAPRNSAAGTSARVARRRNASSTVQCVGSAISSGTYATPCASTNARGSSPSMRNAPDVGRKKPSKIASKVVFPAPLGPAMPRTSPAAISSETSSTARTVRPSSDRYSRVTSRRVIMRHSESRAAACSSSAHDPQHARVSTAADERLGVRRRNEHPRQREPATCLRLHELLDRPPGL